MENAHGNVYSSSGYVHLSEEEPLDVTLDKCSDQAMFLFNQMISAISYDLRRFFMEARNVADLWK